jgi:hypothetical protein
LALSHSLSDYIKIRVRDFVLANNWYKSCIYLSLNQNIQKSQNKTTENRKLYKQPRCYKYRLNFSEVKIKCPKIKKKYTLKENLKEK